MTKKKRIKQNITNVIVFLVCLSLIFIGNSILIKLSDMKAKIKDNIEVEWRVQAKRTLVNLQNQFMYDEKHNVVNPKDELSLQDWAKRNISGILNGGDTGDAFMINLANEKFIWDGSPDCAKPEFVTSGRYLKDEAAMHNDKAQAELVINKMRLATSTTNTYEKNWWNFDGSPEYLEWVVIPPGFLGFNDESRTIGGVTNKNFGKVLIALGTQKDEVESTFSNTFAAIDWVTISIQVFVILSIIICIFNMILYVFLDKNIRS